LPLRSKNINFIVTTSKREKKGDRKKESGDIQKERSKSTCHITTEGRKRHARTIQGDLERERKKSYNWSKSNGERGLGP